MEYDKYRKQLKAFNSTDGRMAYFDEGEGDVILLLHGVPSSSWLYRNISRALVEREYRVIAPDMLGFGASEKPKGYEIYSAENTGKRILELMAYLKIGKWHHVFHDGGGLWTWEMLQQSSDEVQCLVMLNAIVYQEGFKPPLRFDEGLVGKMYARLYSSRIGQAIVLNATFKNGVKDKKTITKTILEGYKKPLLKNGHWAMYYFFTQTCKAIEDYSSLHQSLDIPLSVIWGAADDILVWEEIEQAVTTNFKLLDKENIHILDAKHFIQEEKPEILSRLIETFVKKY